MWMAAKREQERVDDENDGEVGNKTDTASTEILVDDVGHDEHERPEQYARSEIQRSRLPEQLPIERWQAQRWLERKNLDADKLGKNGVGQEKPGENGKQPTRFVAG